MTNKEPQRTPTPWKVCSIQNAKRPAITALGDSVTICHMGDEPDSEVNAAFIVRAVNAHGELVKALKILVEMAALGQEPSAERLSDYKALLAKAEALS